MARRAYPPAGADHPLRRLNPHQCVPFLEGLFQGGREAELEALPSPRLMNTHMPLPMVPSAVPGCRVVYVCRDPKDMAVSAWHFLRRLQPDLAFAVVFESVCDGAVAFGPVWDHVLGYWRASRAMPDKVLFLRYEELLRDPAENVRKLARFLGMPFCPAEDEAGTVDTIVRLCSFDHLKGLDANKTGHLDPLLPIPRDALFRNGASGDWVNHMTPEMASRLDKIVADKMRRTGLTFQ
uniref:Sulfotransferase n=1 Tax=Triticum urartu TaxID=4572 RepID=A0A8R7QUB0_TRIUA